MSVRSKKRKRELDTIDNGGLEEIDNVHNNKNKVKPSKESGFNEHIITPLKKLKDAFTNYISPSKNEKVIRLIKLHCIDFLMIVNTLLIDIITIYHIILRFFFSNFII